MAPNLWCKLTVLSILLPLSSSCLNGWRQSLVDPTKCYLVSVSKKIWFEAEIFCSGAAPDAHLTSIASAFELYNINANVIDTQSISACDQMWIGANNFNQKDQFTWIDGKPFQYSNWEVGQPDTNNQCVSSRARNSGTWRTQPCGTENCFICESYASAITTTTQPVSTSTETWTFTFSSTLLFSTISSSQLTTTTPFPPSTIATTVSLPPPSATAPFVCPADLMYDVFIFLDNSNNANSSQYNEMKDFIRHFIANFTYGPTHSQFLICTVSEAVTYFGGLNTYNTYNQIVSQLYQMPQQPAISTVNLTLGLESIVIDAINNGEIKGYRPNANHLVFYITAGSFSDDPSALAAELRNDKGISFLTVAYGDNADVNKLAQLSGGYDCVIRAGIAGVSLDDAVQTALKKTCSNLYCNDTLTTSTWPTTSTTLFPPSTTPTTCNLQMPTFDIVFLLDTSAYMGQANFNAAKLAILDYAAQYSWANTKFALVVVAQSGAQQFNSFTTADFDAFKNVVELAPYSGSAFANFNSGIGVADQLFTTGNGYRPDAYHMIVFVVGNQIFSAVVAPASAAAKTLRYSTKRVVMAGFAISPTGTTLTDLAQITGGASCTSSAADASQLFEVFEWIAEKTCSLQFCDTSPAG